MSQLIRKSLIYKTGVEYGDYTLNHVFGCSHGCKYPCYAYQMFKRFGKVDSYDMWTTPQIVSNALVLLDKELPKYREKIKILHLCFSTDPFMMNQNEIIQMSINILAKANQMDVVCSVLTKGLLPIELAELNKMNEYGITVITLDENFREKMEPGASVIKDRIQALRDLHNRGCKTWVSMEPYPTPNFIRQDLNEILREIGFVDKIIFGRMHYNKKVSEFPDYKEFYNKCAKTVEDFCVENKINYHIKNGTKTEG